MPTPPSPKALFDAVEGVVGDALERAVQSESFVRTSRIALNLEATVRRGGERVSRRLWHALNLPTGSDVRRLERQLSRLERTVERRLDEVDDDHHQEPTT